MNLKLKHKRLYALLVALCLMLSVAVLLTACKNTQGNDDAGDNSGNNGTPDTPTYEGGPEQGTYYYNVAGGEETLVLSAGSFTYTGTGFSKTGTYTVDGNKMVLTFADTADGTATATIRNDRLAFTYKDATMTFYKNVPYTVSFNVDGGSAIAPITVVNGKTATKPADPTKAGYAFLGWYTDSTLKTAYAFTTPVTANVTLYAKWVQVDASAPVYNVSFDLGYDGAPAIADVTTVNGTVYDLPEDPTRAGYTFAGWWISMFEDGEKLSYKYTNGATLTADTTFYALWVSDDAEIKAPEAVVSANRLSWTPVAGATSYSITLKDGEGNVLNQITTTAYYTNYPFSNHAAGAYSFEITAVGSGGKTSDVAVRYYNNKALDRVSGLKIVDGKLVFNAVENAENYVLTIDCGNKLHNHDALLNGNSTYFDFTNCSMQVGGITFSVVATAEGYADSTPSRVLAFEQNLASVGTVTYDAATDSFVWNAVANATAYEVVVTVGTETYTFKTAGTAFSLANYTGSVSVAVTPVADGYNSPAAVNATADKTAPAAVQNLALNGTVLTWTSNAGAYVVTINGTEYTVTETTLDLAAKLTELNLTAGTEYTVTVVATANGETSAPATLTTVYSAMSTTLTYSDKVVSWPSVIGYNNFKVRVNGGEEITVTGQNFASVVLTKAGENVIEVICTDLTTDWNNASKITVTAYAVKYVTRTTDGGEVVEYLAVGDTLTPPTGLTASGFYFGGWYNTPLGADDNGKEYTETTLVLAADLTLYTNWTPETYKVTLKVDNEFVSNINDGDIVYVTYTKNYKLPVPVSTDESKGFFVGWFNAPNGGGLKMTDDLGNSVEPYGIIGNATLYPYFAEALSFIEQKNDNDEIVGYYVTKGLGISNRNVSAITIPAMYNGKPIIGIADNAFHSCYNIVSVDFPNTVEYVGLGAFELCNKLVAINMYEAVPNYETPYSTYDGALMYYHATSGETYLEVFPAAKIGEYTVSDTVDVIGPGAFTNAKITKVIISKGVTTISKDAFVNCYQLSEIEFMFEREEDVVIEDGAFTDTPNVTKLVLPAKLAPLANIKVFDVFEDLSIIEIEGGSANYSSVNNLICDPFGTKLLYVPRSFKGTFEVPLGITTIGDKLFYQNPYITKVIIGWHVEVVGADAFYGCTGLTEVVVKTPRESLFTINANAFGYCTNLKKVTIEGSDVADKTENMPIYVGDYAFTHCSKLSTVTIGENAVVYEIAASSFAFCTSLENFTVAANATLKNIGNQAFLGCTGLIKFEIHGSTVSVGDGAFENCSKLSTISLGEGTNSLSLGADVFKDCVSLTTIELPASLTSFNSSLFDGCENIQNINVDANNTYLESADGILYTKGRTEIIYYPRTRKIENGVVDLTDSALEKIGPSVFKNNPAVVTVKIGPSVKEIAKNAFENCINLTTVEFTGTNASFTLGAYAFAGCTNLTSFDLPASTTAIGSYAFDHSALASFEIPANVTSIGFNAFAYTNIESIVIPASVTFIGHGAFYHAAKLNSVTFDTRTADIEIGQWDDLRAKAENIIYDAKAGTFVGTALTIIDIPVTATYIGEYAFADLATLGTVNIPADGTLATIGSHAFYNTPITTVTLNEGLTTIDEYAFANTNLTSVNIPKSVQYINAYAFSISTLTSITFTEGSNEGIGLHIANFALAGANLTSIHLPAQLKAFGEADSKYGFSAVTVFYASNVREQSGERFVDILFNGNKNLSTITVSEDNIVYGVVDGVLYKLQARNNNETGTTEYVPVRLLFSPMGNLGNGGKVTVPKTVTMVDYTSFLQTRLTQIVFEEYDKEDPNYGAGKLSIGYYDASKTQHLFPGVITSIVDENISGNDKTYTNLTLIQFPSHLSKINYGAFYGIASYSSNTAVAKIDVKFNPDSEVKFGASAFRASSAIKTLELPMVSYISQMAFYQCYGLTSVTFAPGSTATSIGDRAFADCSKLTSIKIPASIKVIERLAFSGCSKLENFEVEEGSVLESIGETAFQGIGSQVKDGINFVIPATVKAVGYKIFTGAKIIELTLSESLELDGNISLLEGCTTVAKIHVPDNHPTLSSFDGIVYDKDQTAIYMVPSAWNEDQFIIPDTVTVIAASMFANFKGSYVKLPAALTAIADKAFQYSSITHIEIPANVTVIGANAFQDCKNLKTITIPDDSKLTTIGTYAFSNTLITEINLPDSVDTIGTYAFSGCRKLTYFKSPASLKTLESRIFNSCESLTTVELNEGLEIISNSAFASCAITSIVIPNSVKQIIDYAFQQCKSLKSFTCMDASQLVYVGFSTFLNCASLESVTFGPNVKNFGYNAQGKYNTFNGCANLKEINLPAEMVKIPDGFFAGLQKLETLTLPEKLEELGAEAFYNCPMLTTVTIPATLRTIGDAAFASCTSLKTVIFEEGSTLLILPKAMFAECTSLASVKLPAGLIEIGDSAFARTALTTIELPETLEEIGVTAFFECKNLTALTLPDTVLRIGNQAFANCSELAELDLNDGIKAIGTLAFANCSKLTTVTIPATVTSIDGNPFIGCADLVLTLAEGNESFTYENGVLITANGLTVVYYSPANTAKSYTLPDTVVNIAVGAFADSKLETIVLHERIKTITTYAFAYSESLKSINIPASVTAIESSAFAGCSALETITIPASVRSLGDYAFANCSSLATFTLAERKDDITVGAHLFDGCASITQTYEFPGVKDYTPYMYAGTGITSVTFADGANYNVEGVFANSALETVTFGKMTGNMNKMGKALFAGTKIKNITIPEGFYMIPESAFKDCKNLVSVTFSASSIEISAFEGCTALTTVTVVRPSYCGPRDMFQIHVYDRAFANATKLSNTNLFEFAYAFGNEAMLNCSGLTGEISFNNMLNSIGNRAFTGTNLSKLTFSGREYQFETYAFEGLTSSTEVYLSNLSTIEAYIERAGFDNGWYNNTEAKITFYTPNNGEVEVTLTDEELKNLEMYVAEGMIDKSMMDGIKEVWLAYKASFVTLYPAGELTKEEIGALDEFVNNFKIDGKLAGELPKMWIEYRNTLAKELINHPKYFTADELATFDEIMAKGVTEEAKNALKQMWFEYKINFNETNPSDEITKEEMEPLHVLCSEYDIPEGVRDELINRWPEYKKQLAAALVTVEPFYINLTDSELKALENFCANWGIKDGLEDLKLGWMAYKGALVITGKGDAAELTPEEEALVDALVATYGIEPKAAQEFKDSLLRYKQDYSKYFLSGQISINEKDNALLDEFIKANNLTEDDRKIAEQDLLNYKKSFYLAEVQPGKSLTAEEETGLVEFLTKFGLDAKLAMEYTDRFIEYKMGLAG